ncbi:hypothetical protein GCM10010528_20480 [Gordonia defluvii]|uniref:3-methyladenine DNA glycosylase n=1 Tax=Gordonia defluvii TaxID=283718 RepID=A0ABP6LEZ2_9ACTN
MLSAAHWSAAAARHRQRIDAVVGDYLTDRRQGGSHPVVDFLFTYYPYRPAQLRRWHPGYGTLLADPPSGAHPYAGARGYRGTHGGVTVGHDYLRQRERTLRTTGALLAATAGRPPRFGCFGLHEWAMVYRTDTPRHRVPLRLGTAGTDAVVEANQLLCSHFDAFRFFAGEARGRNATALTRDTQLDHEQPGCLHATMDLYRVGAKLSPLVDSNLVADAFDLAYRAREVDMRASPYDLADLGYPPIPIETAAGKAMYLREQQAIADAGSGLRDRLLDTVRGLLDQLPSS